MILFGKTHPSPALFVLSRQSSRTLPWPTELIGTVNPSKSRHKRLPEVVRLLCHIASYAVVIEGLTLGGSGNKWKPPGVINLLIRSTEPDLHFRRLNGQDKCGLVFSRGNCLLCKLRVFGTTLNSWSFGKPWISLDLALKLLEVTVTLSVTNFFVVIQSLPDGRFQVFFE